MAQSPRDAQKQLEVVKAEMAADAKKAAKAGKGAAKKAPEEEKVTVRIMANMKQSQYDLLKAEVRKREDKWERGTPRPTISLVIREAVDKLLGGE